MVPKSVHEDIVSPLHTPGVYTTPRSIHLRICLWYAFLNFSGSRSQKQSINDAFQYVAVLTHQPEGVGKDDAKIHYFCKKSVFC